MRNPLCDKLSVAVLVQAPAEMKPCQQSCRVLPSNRDMCLLDLKDTSLYRIYIREQKASDHLITCLLALQSSFEWLRVQD